MQQNPQEKIQDTNVCNKLFWVELGHECAVINDLA